MRTLEDISAEMQKLVAGADAENRSLSDEEVQTYEGLEKELKAVKTTEEIRSRQSAYTMPVTSSVQTATTGDDTLERAFEAYLRTGQKNMDIAELRAQGTAPDTAGGYLVPDTFRANMIERKIREGGNFMAAAENITTSGGNPISWPTLSDEVEGEIVAEHATGANGADIVFGTGTLGAYKYMSLGAGNLPLRVSVELVQDSAFDINALIQRVLGRRILRAMGRDMVNGSGTNEPLGIMNGTPAISLASGNAITYAKLLDAVHALDPDYRDGASWLFNDNALRALRGLVDGNGRPLFLASAEGTLASALPGGTLLGFPVIVDQSVADMADDTNFAAFGNFKDAYVVRHVKDVTVVVDPYGRAANGEIQYTAWARADGTVQDANAYVLIAGATGA